jgi:hypothetical protein
MRESNTKINASDVYAANKLRVQIATELMA